MHRYLIHRAAALGLAGLAAGLFPVLGCGERRAATPEPSTGELPEQVISDFVMTETDQGRLEWKLYARDAASYAGRNSILGHVVRVDFFDEAGKQSSELTAREGEINQRTRNMTARGNVVIQTHEGTRLSTEELHFLNREQKIVVPVEKLVRVERGGDVLTGYGFESDPDLTHYEFKKAVRAVVRTRSGGVIGPSGGGH